MKRLFRKRLTKMTLLAFATSLFIVPAASAMPMSSDPAATARTPVAFHAQPLTDGWYPAAVRSTLLDLAQGDGWYTVPNPNGSGPSVTPINSSEFPYRNAGIAFAIAAVLSAVFAASLLRARRDRHVPVLQ